MSAADWWGIAWALSGIRFAVVCTAQMRREENTWIGLLPGICIGLMFGPFSLLMVVRNCDEHPDNPRRDCPSCESDRKAGDSA